MYGTMKGTLRTGNPPTTRDETKQVQLGALGAVLRVCDQYGHGSLEHTHTYEHAVKAASTLV